MSPTPGTPRRVLVIGIKGSGGSGGSGDASAHDGLVERARALPPDGMLICIEGGRDAAARATAAFQAAGVAGRAHVMVGDPALFIGKVAGPFDVIVVCVDDDTAARVAPRLQRLLAPDGRIERVSPAADDPVG